jgi:pimeloyl-ACP methyl ester carboxylesterase
MGEIAGAVESVRARGASKIVLVGHSMGCPAAMSYAAQAGGVAGIVLSAPGHSPQQYMQFSPEVRESIERARALTKSGRGAEVGTFYDNNQGNVFTLQAPAAQYLSFFDPSGPCEMTNTAGRIRCPAFWVVGTNDRVINWGDHVARRLAARPRSSYLAIPGAGHGNTPTAAARDIAQWIMAI